jgi:phage protein D
LISANSSCCSAALPWEACVPYDAIAKPDGGALLFIRRGDAQSAIGAALPHTTLTPEDGGTYRGTIASRDSPGTAVVFYRDVDLAERHQVRVGEGEPVKRLRMQYKDRRSAEAVAIAELRQRARRERTLSYSFPGRPEVLAECIVDLQGFREGVAGRWLVTRAEHYIGPDGYRCAIEAEQPNSAPRVQEINGAKIDDQVQEPSVIED